MFMFFLFKYLLWSFGQIIIINTDLKKKQQTIHHFYFNAIFQRQFCRMNENDLYRKKSAVFFSLKGFLTIVSSVIQEKLVNIIHSHQSWQSSARLCEQTNNKLATFKTVEEFLDVQSQLQDFTNRSIATFWLGGREIKSLWVWSHGKWILTSRVTCPTVSAIYN